ncbi:S8 family serine peptidase [Aestuariibacter halophilus]|uniref:S8 family serine peptidase n=1 Tax=Fluctibacter halophilus TaxID=226011 RepID=A0ABS8GA36_9ALTE|nr:S8 family serine peptidase [Aestuariibacter halophilus]MCC2617452.1 S8 family serine peptidase [Aestuariibacter halophilus]
MLNNKITPLAAATLLALGAASVQAAERYVIQVDNPGKGIVKALTKQYGGQVKIDAEGFIAAEFPGKSLDDVKGLLNNPHVKLVEADQVRRPLAMYNDDAGDPMQQQVTPYAVYQSQADQLTFNPNAGMKVCVIDSGLDASNPDFNWSAITGDNDSGTGNWYENGGPHGTHVAGTIGAADNNVGVVGMAPGVDMHIIKVFNAEGWGYSSDLAYAAQKCTQAGANIINMSLGGGGANNTEENAFNAFRDAGGLVVAAAGNDGNNVRSYPAGYSSIMMIGANDADNNIADFSQFPSCTSGRGKRATTDETICVEVTAGGVDTLSTYPAGMATSASLTADGAAVASSAMENAGNASGSTYFMGTAEAVDGAASGKICVIDRGNISFFDKVNNCEASGGIGAVIINNEAGMLYGTLGDTNTTTIPAVGAALEDRSALLAAATMDINIGASDYGLMSGTSMATPAVAGLAALVWSNHPECSGEDIRAAFKATAQDAGVAGKDDKFGYGIVKAADADAYLTANPCGGNNGGGDNGGGTGGDFSLSATGYKQRGLQMVDLSWSGAQTTNVDIYRDGQLIDTTNNDGSYTDALNTKGGGSYDYQVCEEASNTCSATQTVVF